ncbi:MAG: alpha/beta hydrolase [Deltaproteobacteria bacterium]|nr:alpha/beta hydrolase [Deltaproteobacteria bacterium]
MTSDPLNITNVDFSENLIRISHNVHLRVLTWRPKNPKGQPILFVAGWVSAVSGWLDLLSVLVTEHVVYYLETKEKSSAELINPQTQDFYIPKQAQELIQAASILKLTPDDFIIMGSSLGASIILEALKNQQLKPQCAFLIGPTCYFNFPWWTPLLLKLPAVTYKLIKHLALWYLRTFRVDAKAEPEQMQRYEQTLKFAHPQRIKMSAKAFAGFSVWQDLKTITAKVVISYALSDSLHDVSTIKRLIDTLPQSVAVPCSSNKHMHSAALKAEINKYVTEL